MTAVVETADGPLVVDLDAVATRYAHDLLRGGSRLAGGYGREERHFRRWMRRHWGEALQHYLLAWHETNALTMRIHRACQPEDVVNSDQVLEALVRLQARACRVAYDVLVLLRAGVFGGALARCRTLHELAVIARVIGESGRKPEHPDLAERYVLHEKVLAYIDASRYQRHAATLDQALIADEELERLRAEHDQLVDRFGSAYRGTYGWADELPRVGRNRTEFADLIKLAGLQHLEPYFRLASHEIHADATGIRSGVLAVDEGTMLTGGNTTGLAEPANLALILLHHCTSSLVMFGVHPLQVESVIALRAIQVLVDRANAALMAGHLGLEAATEHAMTSRWARLSRWWTMYRLNHAISHGSQ